MPPLRELAGATDAVYAMFNNNGRSEMPSTGLEGLEPEEVAGDPAKGEVAQAPANALMLEAPAQRILTRALPRFSPRSIPMNAAGAFSSPSVTSSRY